MKKFLFSAALLAFALPAFAGVDLTWNKCSTSSTGAGASDIVFDCIPEDEYFAELFATWQAPQAIAASDLVVLEFVLDVKASPDPSPLPPFWRFDVCGTAIPPFTWIRPAATICNATNWYGTGGADGDIARAYGSSTASGRFGGSTFRASNNPYPTAITSGQNMFGFKVTFFTADAASCAGCETPVAMVLNQVNVGLLSNPLGSGVAPEAQLIPVVGPGLVSNCATTGGATSTCAATPAKSKTWGSIKALYR
jgi:hypothetical protein